MCYNDCFGISYEPELTKPQPFAYNLFYINTVEGLQVLK